jgi:SAM-dependent methyltransferase
MIEIRHQSMDSTGSTQAAYNDLYRARGIQQRDSFYLWLISLLKPRHGGLLLDISCGQGRLVTLAARQGLKAIGMDFAIDGLYIGMKETPQASWAVADGEGLPLPDNSIEYVMHIGSLEHYQHPEAGMREIARILKPSGIACVLLPNTFGLLGNIKHAWKTGEIFDDGQPLLRYHTRRGWQDMLVAAGITPYQVLKYEAEWPRTWSDLAWLLKRPSKVAHLFVACFVPLNLANCFVYLCRKNTLAQQAIDQKDVKPERPGTR